MCRILPEYIGGKGMGSREKLLAILAILCVSVLVCGCLGGEQPSSEATDTTTPAAKDNNLTESAVEKIVGKQRSISVNPVSGYVVIRRPDQDYWSLVLQEDDATKMFEKLFKDPRVNLVRITTYLKGVDEYGKEGSFVGTRFIMSRETASKINWDDFLYSNLPNVADEAYINPVLLKN